MSLIIPPSKNYPNPLVAVVSKFGNDPSEGPMQIPLELDWLSMGLVSNGQAAIYVNLQNNNNMAFSQIASLKIDNSQCGTPVTFIFSDTQETITVDAYEPCTVVPVFTAQKQFYALASAPLSNDVTRVQVLNFVPPPVAVDATDVANFALTTGLPIGNAAQNIQLIPAGVNGTLELLQCNFTIGAGPAASSSGSFFVQDGNGNYLVNSISVNAGPNTSTPGTIILDLPDIRWRFNNGVKANWVVGGGGWSNGGNLNITTAYRTP